MTERTERQIKAAQIRARRATKVVLSGTTGYARCWATDVFRQIELYPKCMHFECKKPTVKRIAVNKWGTVCELDVCEEHAKCHGYWMD